MTRVIFLCVFVMQQQKRDGNVLSLRVEFGFFMFLFNERGECFFRLSKKMPSKFRNILLLLS